MSTADGVAIINIVKWQLQTTLGPDNIVTLSRQNCRVPSSALWIQDKNVLTKRFFSPFSIKGQPEAIKESILAPRCVEGLRDYVERLRGKLKDSAMN